MTAESVPIDLSTLKTLYYLEHTLHIKPIMNPNGTFSFKRHSVNEDKYKYLYAKCVKQLGIRTREQLNLLFVSLSHELLLTPLNISFKGMPNKLRISESFSKTLNNIFVDYRIQRERFIFNHGQVLTRMPVQDVQKYKLYSTSYGYIDYYNGLVFIANLNINTILTYNIKTFVTNSHGLYVHTINGEYELFDLKHKNTRFTLWKCRNNDRIARLYYKLEGNTQYIALNTSKIHSPFIPTNSPLISHRLLSQKVN